MADPVRVRAVLDRQFTVVVALLVVLALVGGFLTYTVYAAPGTTTEERRVSRWQTTGWFNYSATVASANPVYPVGTDLTNRSVYFATVAPRLNGTYTFRYDASDAGDLNGTVTLRLVLRGVEEDRDSTTVVWRTARTLNRTTAGSLAPGDRLAVPFSVDVNETATRVAEIDERLDNPPGQPQLQFRATVRLRGTVNGHDVRRTEEYALPVALNRRTYRPANPGKATESHETTRTVRVERTYGPGYRVGGPALLVASLAAGVGLVVARRNDALALSAAEREHVAYEDDRADFEEWISTVALPPEAFDRPRAEASTLGDLVDFAIDVDAGVLESPDGDAYHVLHDGYLYTYQPPADAADDSWDGDADRDGATGRDGDGDVDGDGPRDGDVDGSERTTDGR